MLFDIEDYANKGILYTEWENIIDLQDNGVQVIGSPWGPNPNELITVYGGDMSEWHETARATRDAWFKAFNEYLLAAKTSHPDKRAQFDVLDMEMADAKINYFNASRLFWKAMASIKFLNGRNGGEAAFNEYDPSTYSPGLTVMTQEIYDEYHSAIKAVQSLSKQLVELGEDSTFDY
jgi:hypothetical protein